VGAGFALLVAVAGVAAYLIVGGTHDRKDASVLPTRVVSTQAVNIVNTGPVSQAGGSPAPGTLLASHSDLVFTVNGPAGAQWTSDQMAGGTYIFIYIPDGQCLTSRASPHAWAVTLQRCNLQASQRWLRQHPNVGANGLDYWQLRNLAYDRCLADGKAVGNRQSAAQLEPCEASPGWRQQVALLTAA
jgi:hypothetical protein